MGLSIYSFLSEDLRSDQLGPDISKARGTFPSTDTQVASGVHYVQQPKRVNNHRPLIGAKVCNSWTFLIENNTGITTFEQYITLTQVPLSAAEQT
jgi:hypothetical protein